MSLNLPSPRNVFIPELPPSMSSVEDVKRYLENMKTAIESEFAKGFDNADTVRTASDTLDANATTLSASVSTLSADLISLTTTVSNLSTSLSTSYAVVGLSNLAAVSINTNIGFNSKQALALVVENRTTNPTSTVAGMMWFRTDIT